MRTEIIAAAVALQFVSGAVWAHGESARGSGGSTLNAIGAETSAGLSWSLRYDRRAYEQFTDQQLLDFRRLQGQDVHQHAREQSLFLGLSWGFHEDADLSFLLPFNRFTRFKDNSDDFAIANDTISVTDVSQGLGDLLVLGRYRFWRGGDAQLAAIAGIKLPTGDIRQRTNAGDIVGTHNQPGSGSVDFQLGLAYTTHLFQEAVGLTADVLTRINTQGAGEFRSGNSAQADLSLSFMPHERLVPIVELNFITQERDIERDQIKQNSGVTSLFLAFGAKWSIVDAHTVFAVASLPLWQDLPGIQNKERDRLGVGYGYHW